MPRLLPIFLLFPRLSASPPPPDPVRLTRDGSFKQHLHFSPDGKRVVFVLDILQGTDGKLQIYTCAADGSDVKRLTDDVAPDNNPAWSPDGKKIAFISNRHGGHDVYVMDVE